MNENPYVKPLKPFDPKTDLTVNEQYSPDMIGSKTDALSDLETDDADLHSGSNVGKEFASMKTDAPVIAGVIKLDNSSNKNILLACNNRGNMYLITPEGNGLKTISTIEVQGSVLRTPAYANGIIYCTTREGMIYAINTGLHGQETAEGLNPKIIWQQKMNKGILTEPYASGKLLIVSTLGGLFCYEAYYQDDENKAIGKQLWGKSIGASVSSPAVLGGRIFIGTENKKLHSFDYGGNKVSLIWTFKSSGAVRSQPCVSQKFGAVAAATIDGYIYCIDSSSGKYRWNFVVKAPVYSDIIASSIGNEEHFFFGADNGIFYCLNSLGKRVWEFKTNGKIRTKALVNGPVIYFGSEDNNLYALNIRNGKEIFKFPTEGNINSQPVIIDNIIYFGSTDSFVHGVYIQ